MGQRASTGLTTFYQFWYVYKNSGSMVPCELIHCYLTGVISPLLLGPGLQIRTGGDIRPYVGLLSSHLSVI